MDGDNGREYGKPKLRFSPDARAAFRALKHSSDSPFVCSAVRRRELSTQTAIESVSNENLAGQWPLPIDKPIPAYLTDTAGTASIPRQGMLTAAAYGLDLMDEHTRESLLVSAQRRWSSSRVISALADVMVMKGVPEHLRSDNGPEFVAKDLRNWLANTGARRTSSLALLGRTATARASTLSSGMSFEWRNLLLDQGTARIG